MRRFSLILGCIAFLWTVAPSSAATVLTFSDQRDNNELGVHFQPTGPDDLPLILGDWEVYGSSAPYIDNSTLSRFYSGVAKFDDPVSQITFNVQRLNDSGWRDVFSVKGFDQGKRVASMTVNIMPLGDTTQVTLTAPAIDKIEWGGNGWVFHPYVIRNMQATFLPDATPGVGTPGVGTAVPEPTTASLLLFGFTAILLKRRQ